MCRRIVLANNEEAYKSVFNMEYGVDVIDRGVNQVQDYIPIYVFVTSVRLDSRHDVIGGLTHGPWPYITARYGRYMTCVEFEPT